MLAWIICCATLGGAADGSANTAAPLVIDGIVNAPVAEMWRVFSTADGFKRLGVAHCDLDLRIGGMIRCHYSPQGELGDDGTIHHEILAYEPERMLAFRISKPPKGFPFDKKTYGSTWSIATFTDLGDGRTHVRLTGMGYTDSEDSRKMRTFFEQGNGWVLRKLQQQYDSAAEKPAGPAHPKATTAPLAHERIVNLPRADVWTLLSTSQGWKKFMGVSSKVEMRMGGPFELYFSDTAPEGERGSEGCKVLSFVPGQMLSFTWNAPPKFAHARKRNTMVVIQLDDVSGARTRVRLAHQGFAEQAADHPDEQKEWESVRAYFDSAWTSVLDKLSQPLAAR